MPVQVLEGRTFGTWPTRATLPQTDRFGNAKQRLIDALREQIAFLNGSNGRGRRWYRDGQCRLEVGGKTIVLNGDGENSIPVSSKEEAKDLYEQLLVAVEAAEFDTEIQKHLSSIPPRRKRQS